MSSIGISSICILILFFNCLFLAYRLNKQNKEKEKEYSFLLGRISILQEQVRDLKNNTLFIYQILKNKQNKESAKDGN